MSGKYWIKLYHEILDDAKMGQMPEVLFARCIKIFLVAGDNRKSGELPPVADMAWRLHVPAEELESDLVELARLGITEQVDGRWFVAHFEDRQGQMPESERSGRRRKDSQQEEYRRIGPADVAFDRDATDSRPNPGLRLRTEQELEPEQEVEHTTGGGSILARLVRVGVSQEKARALASDHSAADLDERITQYVFALRDGQCQGPGYLVRAIEEDWAPPRGYQPDRTTERERRKYAEDPAVEH